MKTRGSESWLAAMAFAVSATLLGYAVQLSNGALSNPAMQHALWAFALCLFAVLAIPLRLLERLGDGPVILALGVALAFQIGLQLVSSPGLYLRPGHDLAYHHRLLALAAILCGALLSRRPWLGRLALPALLGVFWLLGSWMLAASPRPFIDVFAWTNEALSALANGKSPFEGPMPNIYRDTRWYAAGAADAQWVRTGYPYPPLGLLLGWLGKALGGDFRFANLACITLAGGCMAYARGGRLGFAAAAAFLLTPRMLFVLEQSWTDAYAVGLLALTVFCALRAPRLTPYAFGLLLVSKQYTLPLAPLALLLIEGPWSLRAIVRFALKAAVPALGVTLPFLVWNPCAFLDSVYFTARNIPFRPDSLSLIAWTAKEGAPTLPSWSSFAAMAVALGLGLVRGARSPAGFAGGAALVIFCFFLFSRHAFCNHYFLVIGALFLAAAAMRPEAMKPLESTRAAAA